MGAGTPIRGSAAGTTPAGTREAVRRVFKNRRMVVGLAIALGAALLLGTGLLAYRLYEARQELKAQGLLGQALTKAEALADVLRGGKSQDVKPEAVQEVLAALQRVREEYPKSRAAGFALLQVAHLQYRLARYADAAGTYEGYLREYPRGPFVFWAAVGQAYSLEGQQEWERAARVYGAAAERHAGSPMAAEALMGVGRCYEALARVSDARAVYGDVVKKYPETVWGSLAERRLALLEAS